MSMGTAYQKKIVFIEVNILTQTYFSYDHTDVPIMMIHNSFWRKEKLKNNENISFKRLSSNSGTPYKLHSAPFLSPFSQLMTPDGLLYTKRWKICRLWEAKKKKEIILRILSSIIGLMLELLSKFILKKVQ